MKQLGLVFASSAIFGLLGAGVGNWLGKEVPGYYRSVFEGGNDPGFDPVAVGIGQGISQGLVLGAVVGVCLVAITALQKRRTKPD